MNIITIGNYLIYSARSPENNPNININTYDIPLSQENSLNFYLSLFKTFFKASVYVVLKRIG